MDYYSGTVSSMTDIRDALVTALTSSGYTFASNVVTKSGTPIELQMLLTDSVADDRKITFTPYWSGVSAGASFKIFRTTNVTVQTFDWPCSYECFIFDNPDEVYFILKYGTEYYQIIAFGNSPVPGVSSCCWYFGPALSGTSHTTNAGGSIQISTSGVDVSVSTNYILGAPLLGIGLIRNAVDNAWTTTWNNATGVNTFRGQRWQTNKLTRTPSPFTTTPLLIPAQIILNRNTTNQQSHFGRLENFRYLRIDNNLPEDIITFGDESWKCYPLFRRNSAERTPSGAVGNHSGTYGYAIRVE